MVTTIIITLVLITTNNITLLNSTDLGHPLTKGGCPSKWKLMEVSSDVPTQDSIGFSLKFPCEELSKLWPFRIPNTIWPVNLRVPQKGPLF